MRIVCQRLAPSVGSLEANSAGSLSAIREALVQGGDVVVLPELATSGYGFDSAEEARSTAIAATDPLCDQWAAEIARVRGGHGLVRRQAPCSTAC